MLRLYVKRETAQNKRKNKVPKLLLSENKVVFLFKFDQKIGLEAATFWRPRNRALVYILK